MSPAPKEHTVEKSIDELLHKIGECLDGFVDTLDAHLSGDAEKALSKWQQVDALESEADAIRRGIVKTLYEGAFLPITREDIMGFVEAADLIADAAESASDELILTKPDVPEAIRADLRRLARESVAGLPLLREATLCVFEDFRTAMVKAEEVGADERAADEIELNLVRDLFGSDIELSRKLHLRAIIELIGDVADRTEDAADRLETLLVKKAF